MKRSLRLVLLIMAMALVAAACGDSGDSAEVASAADLEDAGQSDPLAGGEDLNADDEPAAGEVDQEQALLDFTQCMRDQGIDIDDPTVDADGNLQFGRPRGAGGEEGAFDREAAIAARDACSEFLEGVTLARGPGLDRTAIEDTLVEYAACMRDNGYDMPDPDFGNLGPGQGGGGPFGQLDREDEAFIAADEACRSIFTEAGLGDGPGRGGPGRGTN